jgi:hypothetical protein
MQDHGRIGTKAKPFIRPPILAPGFRKVINPEMFLEEYEQKSAGKHSVFSDDVKTLTRELNDSKKAEAMIKNMRHISKALGINELIAQHVLSDIEFSTNNKFNKEILMNEQLFKDYLKKQLTLNNVYAMEEAVDEYSTLIVFLKRKGV